MQNYYWAIMNTTYEPNTNWLGAVCWLGTDVYL